jgi:ferredoxin
MEDRMKNRSEKRFLKRLMKHEDKIVSNHKNAVMEGFTYLKSAEYRAKPGAVKNRGRKMLVSHGWRQILRLVNHMRKILPSMLRNINRNFSDMEPFLERMENDEPLPQTPRVIAEAYPNDLIWQDLKKHVWEKCGVIVGFTKVPEEYVFEGKGIPFKYALVFAQEMKKDAIEKAPELDAGMEVINVYNSLGIATNEINAWLKETYGIMGMANHPLGGMVDFIPLAEKAGLGKIGRHGLLITREFGPRCRISPIFLDQKLFEVTDTDEHDWLKDFCQNCGNCIRNCPVNAIYETPILSVDYQNQELENRYETFDREACFTSFAAHMGCGVCIKACPFSKNPKIYDKMRVKFNKEEQDA